MPDKRVEGDAHHIRIESDDAADLDLKLRFWDALTALRRRHGDDATWALFAEFMPRKARNRPRDPDGEVARRLRLTYELIGSEQRAGRPITFTTAAKRIDRQHNPKSTNDTWRSIDRERKRLLAVRRHAHSMRVKRCEHLDDDIFFGSAVPD